MELGRQKTVLWMRVLKNIKDPIFNPSFLMYISCHIPDAVTRKMRNNVSNNEKEIKIRLIHSYFNLGKCRDFIAVKKVLSAAVNIRNLLLCLAAINMQQKADRKRRKSVLFDRGFF